MLQSTGNRSNCCPVLTYCGYLPVCGTINCKSGCVTVTVTGCGGKTLGCPCQPIKIKCGKFNLPIKIGCYTGPITITINPPGKRTPPVPFPIKCVKKGKLVPVCCCTTN